MSEKSKEQIANDQRSVVKNPTSDAFEADAKNRQKQLEEAEAARKQKKN
ncbi:MAG: hypothetical protein ACXVP0_14235 [Bacteroidia bacterium]